MIFVGNKVADQSKNIWTQVSKLFDNSIFDYDLVYIAFQSYTRPGNCYYYLDDVEVNYMKLIRGSNPSTPARLNKSSKPLFYDKGFFVDYFR